MFTGVPPACHFKLAWMLLCLSICVGHVWPFTVLPVVFQCRLQKLEFVQWHPSVGLFQLSLSSGVPVHPASIRWVTQWYPSVHWVNQWHSSGIPVYTGPTSVHWLRIRVLFPHWKLLFYIFKHMNINLTTVLMSSAMRPLIYITKLHKIIKCVLDGETVSSNLKAHPAIHCPEAIQHFTMTFSVYPIWRWKGHQCDGFIMTDKWSGG